MGGLINCSFIYGTVSPSANQQQYFGGLTRCITQNGQCDSGEFYFMPPQLNMCLKVSIFYSYYTVINKLIALIFIIAQCKIGNTLEHQNLQ